MLTVSGPRGFFRVESNEAAGWLSSSLCVVVVVVVVVVWLWLCVVVAVAVAMAVVVVLCVCVRCGVCRDTLKNPTFVHSKRPLVYRHQAHMYKICGRGAGAHGDAFDAYTASSSLNTHNHIQQHTTIEHSTTKDNRQLTIASTRSETKHQPPATAHLSEHQTQAKKPTQHRQPKQQTNTSTREHERRDTGPEP